jgi:hypothetical protein
MPDHKFQVGQTVFLEGSRNRNIPPGGEYVITKKLPERNGGSSEGRFGVVGIIFLTPSF